MRRRPRSRIARIVPASATARAQEQRQIGPGPQERDRRRPSRPRAPRHRRPRRRARAPRRSPREQRDHGDPVALRDRLAEAPLGQRARCRIRFTRPAGAPRSPRDLDRVTACRCRPAPAATSASASSAVSIAPDALTPMLSGRRLAAARRRAASPHDAPRSRSMVSTKSAPASSAILQASCFSLSSSRPHSTTTLTSTIPLPDVHALHADGADEGDQLVSDVAEVAGAERRTFMHDVELLGAARDRLLGRGDLRPSSSRSP